MLQRSETERRQPEFRLRMPFDADLAPMPVPQGEHATLTFRRRYLGRVDEVQRSLDPRIETLAQNAPPAKSRRRHPESAPQMLRQRRLPLVLAQTPSRTAARRQ